MDNCELCGLVAATEGGEGDWRWYTCDACGRYRVGGLWRRAFKNEARDSAEFVRLRGVVRRETDQHDELSELITTESWQKILDRHDEPASPLEQMDRVLATLAKHSPFVGAPIQLGTADKIARRLYMKDSAWVPKLLAAMQGMGFIGIADAKPTVNGCYLTLHGWERAERSSKTARSGDQAFVAMWFHDGMAAALANGIEPALRECGYSPYVVNRAPSNNKIDDDIIANLRKSRIVVADLTGLRPSVFYEAGFAHGLGTPLILTCHRGAEVPFVQAGPDGSVSEEPEKRTWADHVERHAFDVRNYPIHRWSDHAELHRVLALNIRARGLDLAPITPA